MGLKRELDPHRPADTNSDGTAHTRAGLTGLILTAAHGVGTIIISICRIQKVNNLPMAHTS